MARFLVDITEVEDKPGGGCLFATLGIMALFVLVYWLVGIFGGLYSKMKEKYSEVKEKITNYNTHANHESSKIHSDSTTYVLKKTNNTISGAIVKEKNTTNKEKDTSSLISTMIRPGSSYNVKYFLGEWNGKYGNGKITIIISEVDENDKVSGSYYLEDKNVRFKLSGIKKGNEFELKELGDNEWDGSFKFTIIDNAVNGNWISNNGELTRNLILTRQ